MSNPPTVQSSIAYHVRVASALLGRAFAWIGAGAIGLVFALGRIARAILGEIAMQFLMIALWFRWLVKLAGWACVLSAAMLQYQVPGQARQNLLMFGVGLLAIVAARGMTVLEYRIRQHRFLIMAGAYRSALQFSASRDESFM